jgi:hypothetical protein
MSTDAKVFYYEGAYAATGTTIRSYSEKATDPLLQIVITAAGTREALSPEEIEEREWDRLLASPESQADMKKMAAKIEANIASGKSIKYVPGKSLAELFRA